MATIFKTLCYLSTLFFFVACISNDMKTYPVNKTAHPIQLTGKGDDPAWQQASVLTDFSYPWRDDNPPATTFRALWDDAYLYFLYRAEDPDIVVKNEKGGERDVVNSDRVEIFFKSDDRMDPYYALEMDALGRVLDTEGRYYRKIDYNWNWPEGQLLLYASMDEEGYWVEGAVSLASLRRLGMLSGKELKAGLYRGEYLYHEGGETEVRWISWVIPDSEKPDFHIPSSFGKLLLVD